MFGNISKKDIIIKITAAVVLFAVIFNGVFWYLLSEYRVILPLGIRWNEETQTYGDITVELKKRKVKVIKDEYSKENSEDNNEEILLFESEENVKVSDVFWGDIDDNGEMDLILLCWKKGKYGSYKPFWIEKDEGLWSQHLYIYLYDGKIIRPKWMASNLGFRVSDIEFDGKKLIMTDRDTKEISYWKWEGFGIRRIK